MKLILDLNDKDQNVDSEFILFNLDSNSKEIQTCLEIVSNYIIEQKLMIVGGMSIDFALKCKGDSLYSEYQIPDYDVIDPNNVEHANNIAMILCNKGFKNISVVPAFHKTTVRVQLMGNTVFDSTFIPEYLYKKIPYMMWNSYKFIDPIYQKIDQYTSLAFLWNITGPSFNVINRLSKDIKRKELLSQYYNFSYDIKDSNDREKKNITLSYTKHTISNKIISNSGIYSIDSDFIYHGKLAYALIFHKFKDICKMENIEYESNKVLACNIEINKEDIIFEYMGDSIEIIHYGNEFEDNKVFNKIFKSLDMGSFKKKKLSKISTAMPANINFSSEKYDINVNSYDLTGDMLSINSIIIEDKKFILSNYNYILSYFLFSFYYHDNELDKNVYANYYLSLKYMLKIIQELNIDINESDNLFDYSLNNLGTKYWIDENYNFYIQNYKSYVNTKTTLNSIPPKNYISYPACEIKKIFKEEDRNKSEFYLDANKEIEHTNFLKELNSIV